MSNYNIEQVGVMLKDLKDQVKSGFQGVHDRQDKTNGQVKENTDWRLTNDELVKQLRVDREAKFKRYSDIIWKLGTVAALATLGIKTLM